MALAYAYRGNDDFIAAMEGRLSEVGYVRTEDAAAADVLLSFCTSHSQLEELYFGEAGFMQQARPGAVLVDVSACTPNLAREMNAVATVSDMVMVEAPFVLHDLTAEDGLAKENLLCFVSNESEGSAVDEVALPLLDALFGECDRCGAPGNAQLMRAAHTLQATSQMIGVMEADALCSVMARSVNGSAMGSLRLEADSAQALQTLEALHAKRFEGSFTVEMLMAALSSAIMAADDAELILPQAEAGLHLLELLAVIGGSDKAPAALALVYGDEAECAAQGLDWSRAEQVYGEDHDHDHDNYAVDDFDDDDYDDYDAGFDYSAN